MVISGGWDNTQSAIRNHPGGALDDVEPTQDIVSCDEARQFWASWTDKTVQVGRGGEVGQEEFLQWPDANFHPVFSVGLATYLGVTGQWIVGNKDGKSFAHAFF